MLPPGENVDQGDERGCGEAMLMNYMGKSEAYLIWGKFLNRQKKRPAEHLNYVPLTCHSDPLQQLRVRTDRVSGDQLIPHTHR